MIAQRNDLLPDFREEFAVDFERLLERGMSFSELASAFVGHDDVLKLAYSCSGYLQLYGCSVGNSLNTSALKFAVSNLL